MLDKGLDKGRLCVGDWRLIGFSWRYRNILEIVWAFSVFWSRPKQSLPRSGGNAFTTPRGSTWVDLNCIRFVIVMIPAVLARGCLVFIKDRLISSLRFLRFRVFWVLLFRDLGASFSIGASFPRFRWFVFEICVLRASVFVFECFVFETTSQSFTNFSTNANLMSSQPKAKLPKLALPKFWGEVTQWQNFGDSFNSAIHVNQHLSLIDKFNHLHSLLEGQAARAIQGLTTTEANHNWAIEILPKRFGKPQNIIFKHRDSCTLKLASTLEGWSHWVKVQTNTVVS